MPRDIPTYSVCAGPGIAHSHKQLGGIAGFLTNLILYNTVPGVAFLLTILIGLILANSPYLWFFTGMTLIAGLNELKDWYYNTRLLCISERECAIGTVITKPTANFDGDRKINLMLAPHSQRDWVQTLLDQIRANKAMLQDPANFNDPPFHTSPPVLDQAVLDNNFSALQAYLYPLRGKDPDDSDADSNMYRQILVGLLDRLMADPSKNFYNRLHRKDSTVIAPGTALSDAIPEDFDPDVPWRDDNPPAPGAQSMRTHSNPYEDVDAETLNPMYRFDIRHAVGYLHCEIEGYYIKLLVDNLIIALAAFMATIALLGFFTGFAPLIGLAAALLVYLIKWLIDKITGNDGSPGEPDLDVDDPDFPAAGVDERVGDVVVTYGNWIMDTEHHNYFEIHPVRAWYLVARNKVGEAVLVDGNLKQEEFGYENFDITQVDDARRGSICAAIDDSEDGQGGGVILRSGSAALSYGLTTRYGGGRAQNAFPDSV